MSGGGLVPQGQGDHQVVIFTFAGAITKEKAEAWNNAIKDLKTKFKPNVMAVTIKGEKSLWKDG